MAFLRGHKFSIQNFSFLPGRCQRRPERAQHGGKECTEEGALFRREIHDLLAVFQQNVIRPAVFLHAIIQKGFPRHLAETGERIVVDLLGDDIRIDLHLLLVAADGLVQVVLPGLVQHAASENPHGNEKHHCRQKGNFLP